VSSYSGVGYYAETNQNWYVHESVNWTFNAGGNFAFDTSEINMTNGIFSEWGSGPMPPDDEGFAPPMWWYLNFSPAWEKSAVEYSDANIFLQRTNQTKVMIAPSGCPSAGIMNLYLVRAHASEFSAPNVPQDEFYYTNTVFDGTLYHFFDMDLPMAHWLFCYYGQPGWYGGDVPLPPEWLQINGQTLVNSGIITNGSVWGATFVKAPASATPDVTPTATNFYVFNDYTFDVQALNITHILFVDNNRDDQISTDGSDDTTASTPFRFWINDSQEHGDDESSGGADDQIPGQSSSSANYSWNHVQGRSDYVNFFPVALCLSNVFQWLPFTNGFEYHLSQADGAVKFAYTSLTQSNAFEYLTNSTDANNYGSIANYDPSFSSDSSGAISYTTLPLADLVKVPETGMTLNTNWLTQVQNNNGIGIILMEGTAATTQPLMLGIWHKDQYGNNKLMGDVPLYLSITNVEQMFRHLNLCAYGNGTPDPLNPSRAFAPNEPDTQNKNLVFVHGYNVNQQQARGVESEMFKRFYWSGSKAKFYGITWNGAVSQGDMSGGGVIAGLKNVSCNLQTNIVNAFLTAPHLADFLKYGLSGETMVVAHSLGNMVCLSAINDYHAPINKYFMIDSAVAIEAIDGSTDVNSDMIYPEWSAYDNRLRASEWYNLFPGDARGALTWRDRLSDLSSAGVVYNFYSIGEEVLRDFAGTPPSDLTSSINDILAEMSVGTDKAAYAWVWQEKDKGRMSGNNFISSNHGGWAFNYYYYPMLPGDASLLADSQLQINAFFDFSSDFTDGIETVHGTMPGTGSNQADMALYGAGGSTYAQANRDRILSDAIPALTLPAGANSVPRLAPQNGEDRNFNMSSTVFENGWPRTIGQEAFKWHHSDFDYVAYPFTYQLFNKIVTLGNLK
jgi:hypothetical protein